MSLEDVEKIMDETQEAVEYQRVRKHTHSMIKWLQFTFREQLFVDVKLL